MRTRPRPRRSASGWTACRLRSRLDFLGRGPRDSPARQQTLRGLIEWSHDLLDSDERAIFQLLAVFETVRIEAVAEMAARLGALRDVDVAEGLASLIDKSLLRRAAGAGGAGRLSMLETIRDYAAERLDEEPELSVAARQAHAEHFADYARSSRGGSTCSSTRCRPSMWRAAGITRPSRRGPRVGATRNYLAGVGRTDRTPGDTKPPIGRGGGW